MNAVSCRCTFVAVGFVLACFLAGCSNPNLALTLSPQPTSVIFSPNPPSSLAVNATTTINAVTIYPAGAIGTALNTQVNYTLDCASSGACGTLGPNAEAGAVTYTAPSGVPSGGAVSVTATSIANSKLSQSAIITIVPPIPISVTFFAAAPASLVAGSQVPLRAQITNDVSADPQVKWTVTCGVSDCGSFNPTTTFSESPATYAAPATIPTGNTVTVTATSVTDPTKSVSAKIVITAPGPTLADGTYVFQTLGSTSATGVVVLHGGNIIGGEQDSTSLDAFDSPTSIFQKIIGGTYSNTPDGHVLLTIQAGSPPNSETLTGTLNAGANGFISGVDGTVGNTTLDPLSSTPVPSGGYAVALYSGNLFLNNPSLAGIVNVDGPGAISGAGSTLDFMYYQFSGDQAVGASTVTAPDQYGRVLFQINPGPNSKLAVLNIAGYIVDSTHIRLIVAGDPQQSNEVIGDMAGIAIAQGASTGKYSATFLVGTSYVFGASGGDSKGELQAAGEFHLNADGTVSGKLDWNDLGGQTAHTPLNLTGTYSVDPTGRVAFTNITDNSTFNFSFNLYLGGAGDGPVLSTDANSYAFTGRAYRRQASSFSASSFAGFYGLNSSLFAQGDTVPAGGVAVGTFTATASTDADTLAGYADLGNGAQDFAFGGSFTAAADGAFTGIMTGFDGIVSGFDAASPSTANSFSLFMIDATQGVLIETDSAQLLLGRVELVHSP